MNKIFKIMGIAALMTGMTTGAMAQEQTQETEKPGFLKQAFRDMKESAKAQHEVDKANFAATKWFSKRQVCYDFFDIRQHKKCVCLVFFCKKTKNTNKTLTFLCYTICIKAKIRLFGG